MFFPSNLSLGIFWDEIFDHHFDEYFRDYNISILHDETLYFCGSPKGMFLLVLEILWLASEEEPSDHEMDQYFGMFRPWRFFVEVPFHFQAQIAEKPAAPLKMLPVLDGFSQLQRLKKEIMGEAVIEEPYCTLEKMLVEFIQYIQREGKCGMEYKLDVYQEHHNVTLRLSRTALIGLACCAIYYMSSPDKNRIVGNSILPKVKFLVMHDERVLRDIDVFSEETLIRYIKKYG